jgi:hypothetical protein
LGEKYKKREENERGEIVKKKTKKKAEINNEKK